MRRFRSAMAGDYRSSIALLALIVAGRAEAQAPAGPSGDIPVASTPEKTTKVADLTNRYRFIERYRREEDKGPPGAIGAYRVGIVDIVRDSVDTPQGAPRRMESIRQAIFTERPAEIGGLGEASSTVRTFERYRAKPEDRSRMTAARPLEGLSAVIRPRVGELPQILSLTEGRRLTDYEFEVAAREVFVPQLASALPAQAVRVGDTWRVSRRGAQAMLGDPGIQGDTLVGKLTGLRKEAEGPRMVAQIALSGKVVGSSGEATINAELAFVFLPESTTKEFANAPKFPPRPTTDVIEGRGAFTELRLGRLGTAELPGPGRLKFRSNREIVMHRQLEVAASPLPAAPRKPPTAPAATEANSWLSYLEPAGKFSFQHPQDLIPPDRGPVAPLDPNVAILVRPRREGTDLLQLEFVPKALGPEALKQKLAAKWGPMKQEVLPGAEEWLPESDWPGMKVHRIEAAVKLADPKAATSSAGSARIHFDGYLVQFGQSASILAVATTSRDAVAPFRREVEQILKTLQVNPGRPMSD